MKREQSEQCGNTTRIGESGYEASQDDLTESDLERVSVRDYEHRQRTWTNFNFEDWWIAVAVYLVLSGVAFVAV